ncbi:ABC transporter, transmembrane domain, type 1 [Cordyceps fumosorosea ARSEF 2679]|uniref:ABC transporter, transmembrane domain, type 1 n=1 Tax=Cordyceps fumosorosea (strain ARSEF 2679) TaxID=1081104 RepID=A0A167WMR5_CORFA|nr:ABC transporter, transmembrane domain, type 1 [Cordyceps fumosorosea ARSEF 2679]OAA63985.1 ABC transporter, transmembrane domain, type 1 [Cordyceps fumosorosea ARSEF 2679]
MPTAGDDQAFGPQHATSFDFTLKFEQTALGILPTGLLIAAAPLFVYVCKRRPACARAGITLWIKLAATLLLFALEISSLILYCKTPSIRSDTALAAASVSSVASFTIIILIVVEHRFTLRPTSLLSLYILLSLALDIVKSRSYFLRHGLGTLGGLSAAAAAVKAGIIGVQEVPKTTLLLDEGLRRHASKESTSGFWSRSVFAWLHPIFSVGFRQTLSLQDLEPLDTDLSTRPLFEKFSPHWDTRKTRSSNGSLVIACFATLWRPFCAVILPRLLYSGLTFAQPFLLQRILDYVQRRQAQEYARVGLIAASGLVFGARGLARAAYMHANYRCVTAVRAVLIAAMADKQLRLTRAEAKKSAISTLMTADVEGIEQSLPDVHDLWSYLLDISFGLFLLYKFIGLASLTVFGPFVFSILYGIVVGNWSGKALATWNASIESRVSNLSIILSQQIPIRMMGLGPMVSKYAQKLRETEMDCSRRFRVCTTTTMTGALAIEALTPVIILAAALFWTRFDNGFTAYVAFPTLSLIAIVQMPLFYLVDTYTSLPKIWECMKRIQNYLQLPEWIDRRQHHDGDVLQLKEHQQTDAHHLRDEGEDGGEAESRQMSDEEFYQEKSEEAVVELKDAWVGPAGQPVAILQGINLRILRSRIIALIGSISCGKSTFLQTLIGEGTILHGAVIVAKLKWAFCDQSPYLTNASIRDNIIGPNTYDQKWYHSVVGACQLLDDFGQLAASDKTVVGSDGMNLSVGQRHRVALARAVYTRADIVIVDDIFGSQDQITARAIIKRLLGPDGLLRRLKTTVVFATHLGIALDVADELFQIHNTKILHYKEELKNDVLKECLVDAMGLTKQMAENLKATKATSTGPPASKPEADIHTQPEDEAAEDLVRTRGEFGLYRFYFGSFAKARVFVWVTSMLIVVFCDNFPNGYVRIWVEYGPNNNLYLIGFALIAFARVTLGLWSQRLFYLRILPESGARLHQLLLDASMNATYNFICTVDSGSLLNRFSQDMSLVVQTLPIAMYRFIFMLYSSFISIGFVMAASSYATIALPIIVAAIYFIQKYYLRTSRQLRYLDLESKTPLFVRFKETANGLHHIRSFGWLSTQLEKNLVLLDASQRAYYHMFCVQRWLNLVLDLLVAVVAVFVVSIALYVKSSSSPAAMGLAYLTLIDFGGTLTIAVKRWTEMEIALGSIARSKSFVQDTPQEKDGPDCSLPKDWPRRGEIEFKNVTAGYNADSVLTDISFTILSGDKVAITGRSGSGKSSLLVTLLNFLDYSGSIRIDGVDISQVPRQALRERITTISQTPVILDGSVRSNLVPFVDSGFPESIIKTTLRQLGLWEVIRSRGGLDQDIQEAGLSAAQQQLLCIARALLHHVQTDSKIILLDEVTASLSTASTLEVQRIFVDAFQGCTVLNIAHWDSPIQKPDLKLNIVNGKLASAWRSAFEPVDEETIERDMEQAERCMEEVRRLRLKEDAEQRQLLARERAFEEMVGMELVGSDCMAPGGQSSTAAQSPALLNASGCPLAPGCQAMICDVNAVDDQEDFGGGREQ